MLVEAGSRPLCESAAITETNKNTNNPLTPCHSQLTLQATRVVGVALDKLLACVHGLLQAQILTRGWEFDTSHTGQVVTRLRTAALHAGRGKWHIHDVVQRYGC